MDIDAGSCSQGQGSHDLGEDDLKMANSMEIRRERMDSVRKDMLNVMESMAVTMDEQKSGMLETDSSISVLEVPWGVSTSKPGARASSTTSLVQEPSSVFPSFIDPLFLGRCFIVPATLRGLIEKMDEKRFVYKFSEGDVLKVIRSEDDEVIYSLDVFDFERDGFNHSFHTNIAFVINKNKYRSLVKAKQKNEYRAAIERGEKYHREVDMYSEKINDLYGIQIRNGMNFIFIDEPQDLLREMKTISKYLSLRKVYIPKTKVFTVAQKAEHLQNFLQNIPGIGKNVARSLSCFGSIGRLYRFIKESKDDSMKEFRIWDEEGRHSRPLGEKQYSKIKSVFIGRKRTPGQKPSVH